MRERRVIQWLRFHSVIRNCSLITSILVSAFCARAEEGGVIYDREGLGIITGAYYVEGEDRLYLVGNGEYPEVTPSERVVATAFQWAFAETARMPYVSIDPIPEDPTGPFMIIDQDEVSKQTEFGWVLFEADRLLKCLGMGVDNIFRLPETSTVPGYMDMFDLGEKNEKFSDTNKNVWSRFWFHPLSNKVQWDESVMRILDCRVGVKTEEMTLKNGKLESTNGKQDRNAREFAAHFTANYRKFGEEFPVFMQLEQQARLILISDWLRQIRDRVQPVSLAWVRSEGGKHFDMPLYTPSLRATRTKTVKDKGGTLTSSREIYGGVDLGIKANKVPADTQFNGWKKRVTESGKRKLTSEEKLPEGVERLIPATGKAAAEGEAPKTLLAMGRGKSKFSLETRDVFLKDEIMPGLAGKELAMPFLPSFRPGGFEGKVESIGVKGKDKSLIEKRTYELMDPAGRKLGWFDQHRIDPVSGEILIESSKSPSSEWRLSPDSVNPGAMWAIEGNQRKWAFDIKSGKPIAEFRDGQLYLYRLDGQARLEKVEMKDPQSGQEEAIVEIGRDEATGLIETIKTNDDQLIRSRSEARSKPTIPSFEFKVTNEGREQHKVRFDTNENSMRLEGGGRLREKGYSAIEANRAEVREHFERGAKEVSAFGNDGYVVTVSGKESVVWPTTKSDLVRKMAIGAIRSSAELKQSELIKLFPENSESPTYVADQDLTFRANMATVGGKLLPGKVFSTARPEIPKTNLENMLKAGESFSGGQGITLKVDRASLEGQTGAAEALKDLSSSTPAKMDANTPRLAVYIGHDGPGARERFHQFCQENKGAFVVAVICNSSGKVRDAQEFADRAVENGATAAMVTRGFFDAKDAAKLQEKWSETANPEGKDPIRWFQNLLKDMGLEKKFLEPTVQVFDAWEQLVKGRC